MAMREASDSVSDIGRALVVNDMTVPMWWDCYQVGGLAALAARKRGPATGAHRSLAARQAHAMQPAVTDTTPDQIGLPLRIGPAQRSRSSSS
jgi:transposase-like protein